MAYLVLARKWRPKTWNEVIAQEHVTLTLQNAINYNRLAHAYLFAGPRGVGKTSVARILAKALNCEKNSGPDPCNECSNCNEITDGRSIDVFEIDGASNRGIDEVRNLRENIRYVPARGKYRIYIIDEVHMLTSEAFNALLKTLEEPPDHVIFIFATTEPQKVPATILSRCQRFDFRRIGSQDIVQHLKHVSQEEKIEIEETALQLIAKKADGGLRDSQSILDQMVSYTGNKIKAEDVSQALGFIEQEIFFEVTNVLAARNISKGLALIDKIIGEGYDIGEFLSGLMEHLRNILIVKAMGSGELIETSITSKTQYEEALLDFQEEDLLRLIKIVANTSNAIKRSVNKRIQLELAILKMIKLDKTVHIDELLSYLNNLKYESPIILQKNQQNDSINKNPSKSPIINEDKPVDNIQKKEDKPDDNNQKNEDVGEQSVTIEDIAAKWMEVITQVKARKITLGSFLQEGFPVNINNNILEIGFGHANGFHIDAIMRSKNIVLEVFKAIFNIDIQLRCIKGDFPQLKKKSPKENKEEKLNALGEDDNVIKKLIDDFDVEIID
jgi:DNA polymerase-3 subunit gamma/tau